MHELNVASRNLGKLKEIAFLLRDIPVFLHMLQEYPDVPDAVEDGKTFMENAMIKARHVYEYVPKPVLADDSGLEVDALDGEPGILSARFGGSDLTDADRCMKLLKKMRDIPEEERGAQFRCVAVFKDGEEEIVREGVCRGTIAMEPKGYNGFGYDPVFIPEGHTETFAQLPSDVKNLMSHRAQAFLQIREDLAKRFTV